MGIKFSKKLKFIGCNKYTTKINKIVAYLYALTFNSNLEKVPLVFKKNNNKNTTKIITHSANHKKPVNNST